MKNVIDFEDFDFEEEYDGIEIGDLVKLKRDCHFYVRTDNENFKSNLTTVSGDGIMSHHRSRTYYVTKIEEWKGVRLIYFEEKWPWYDSKYWEKVK